LGAALAVARSQLETSTALAIVTVMIASLLIIEYVVLEPIKRELEAWRD
jgi:NitT/TauT family transport system permease protein